MDSKFTKTAKAVDTSEFIALLRSMKQGPRKKRLRYLADLASSVHEFTKEELQRVFPSLVALFESTRISEADLKEEEKEHRELTNVLSGALEECAPDGLPVPGFMDLVRQWRALFAGSSIKNLSTSGAQQGAEAFHCDNCGEESDFHLVVIGVPVRLRFAELQSNAESDDDPKPSRDRLFVHDDDFEGRVTEAVSGYETQYAEIQCKQCMNTWIIHKNFKVGE